MRLDLYHDPRVQLLIQHLGEPIPAGETDLRFNSPFDSLKHPGKPDTNRHLYVNPRKGKFICYRSNECGSLSYLFYLLGEACDVATPVKVQPIQELRDRLEGLDRLKTFVLPIAQLPDWYTPVRPGSMVHRYLLARGLTDDDITEYRLGEGLLQADVKVIIPSFGVNGECEYWVARSICPLNKRRYTNPPVHRRYHVGFLQNALRHSPGSVILCEGVFSAIVGGRDCVATYGKLVTRDQLMRLWQAGVRVLRVALDGDARREALAVADRATRMGFATTIVSLPVDKDPADLGRAAFRALLGCQEAPVGADGIGLLRLRLAMVR